MSTDTYANYARLRAALVLSTVKGAQQTINRCHSPTDASVATRPRCLHPLDYWHHGIELDKSYC